MNGLINFMGNSALNSFKKFSNEVNRAINDFEFEDIDKAFEKAQKRLNKSMKRLKKRVSNTDNELVINIPYDREVDTITTRVTKDGQFEATVKSEDETSERTTSIYLDENVDVDSLTRKYDSEKKLMYFTFKKF